MASNDEESREGLLASFLGDLKFGRNHIKALLRDVYMREGILERTGREKLVAAHVDNLSASDFDALCDAAWEVFNDQAPVVKTYTIEGDEDTYPVQILGVKGAYMVRASEFDDKGMFGTLNEAKACVDFNWLGEAKEEVT